VFNGLWSFNPFASSVLYVHATKTLGLDETTYGATKSWLAVGAIAGSIAYGALCRRVSFRVLIHVSIVAGILSTAAYWWFNGAPLAYAISVFVGFSYLIGCLVIFDLAARSCPVETAGTTFALIMGISNLSASLAAALGGWCYDRWTLASGEAVAFDLLVGAGALTNAACWLVVPFLKRNDAAGSASM
jgi:predicted MFS family arabinose efflux permease